MGGALFDRIAVADWSAKAAPATGQDSIWIATLDVVDRSGPGPLTVTNPPTRLAALDQIATLAEPGRRTLLGVDFSLGFPAGTATAAGLEGTAWEVMWAHLAAEITDDERNRNNRFVVAERINRAIRAGAAETGSAGVAQDAAAGPFWGCPPHQATAALTTTKPPRQPRWPDEWRVVEALLRAAGHRPFSAWQLLGAGAVGSQSLMGIAVLERLRQSLGPRMAVWPFTTGFDLDNSLDPDVELVVAEVWPSLRDVVVAPGKVKDAAQVESTARWLAGLDSAGELSGLFRPAQTWDADGIINEEGWVLGVTGESG